MIEFTFFEPDSDLGVVKATIHKTGKLGFSSGAAKKLKLEKTRYFKIGRNASDETDKSIYMIAATSNDKTAYKVSKAGEYFYLRIKNIIDALQYDYLNDSVIFDIREIDEEPNNYYKLSKRK